MKNLKEINTVDPTEEDFISYSNNENSNDPCIFCNAEWVELTRIHDGNCKYWSWLISGDDDA